MLAFGGGLCSLSTSSYYYYYYYYYYENVQVITCRLTTSNNVMRDPVRISNPMYNADYRMTGMNQQQQQLLQHQRCLSTEGE